MIKCLKKKTRIVSWLRFNDWSQFVKITLYFTWLLRYLYPPLFRFSVHYNLFRFNQPSFLRKPFRLIFFFLSCSGTTFENTVDESSPQNVSTGKLNLLLIVIVLLTLFIVAISVVFGILFFRWHQSHKNQGKFLASFIYLLILSY